MRPGNPYFSKGPHICSLQLAKVSTPSADIRGYKKGGIIHPYRSHQNQREMPTQPSKDPEGYAHVRRLRALEEQRVEPIEPVKPVEPVEQKKKNFWQKAADAVSSMAQARQKASRVVRESKRGQKPNDSIV